MRIMLVVAVTLLSCGPKAHDASDAKPVRGSGVDAAKRPMDDDFVGPPQPKVEVQPSPIARAFSRKVSRDIRNLPLKDVIAYLREYSGLRIVIDGSAWETVTNSRVTVLLQEAPFEDAVRAILKGNYLTFRLEHTHMLITDESAARVESATYSVADLIGADDAGGKRLADIVRTVVRAASGEGDGVIACRAASDDLVVTATVAVHRDVEALLEGLRGAAGHHQEVFPTTESESTKARERQLRAKAAKLTAELETLRRKLAVEPKGESKP